MNTCKPKSAAGESEEVDYDAYVTEEIEKSLAAFKEVQNKGMKPATSTAPKDKAQSSGTAPKDKPESSGTKEGD